MSKKKLVVNEDKLQFNQLRHLMSNLVRKEKLDGKEHLVVPTILIVEGVHNSLMYPLEEIAKFPEAWDGRPVVVEHPAKDGSPISANKPSVIESQTVGKIFNTRLDGTKLKAETWIDIEKAKKLEGGKTVLSMLNKNKPIEVSTGLFLEQLEETEGDWNGEAYSAKVVNYRPDHLALLPNGIGACSWEDGAGMPRVNQQQVADNKGKANGDINADGTFKGGFDGCVEHFIGKGVNKEGAAKLCAYIGRKAGKINERNTPLALLDIAVEGVTVNQNGKDLSYDDIRRKINEALDSQRKANPLAPMNYPYIMDVYDGYFVFELSSNGKSQLYQQDYSVDGDAVTLDGNPVMVEKKVQYKPKNQTNNSSDGETPKTNAKGGSMEREEAVNKLIANEKAGWVEEDREFLMGLNDAQFAKVEKLTLEELEQEVPPTEEAPKDNKKQEVKKEDEEETTCNEEEKKEVTTDEFIANAPAGIRETLKRAYDRDCEIKANAIKKLVDNKANTFTKEELEAKSLAEIEKLAHLARVEVDFSGKGSGQLVTANSSSEEPLVAPVMNFKKEEKKA